MSRGINARRHRSWRLREGFTTNRWWQRCWGLGMNIRIWVFRNGRNKRRTTRWRSVWFISVFACGFASKITTRVGVLKCRGMWGIVDGAGGIW